jgi:hypothetical protein
MSSTISRDRTVKVAGAQVSVRRTGATVLIRIVQPDNGWRMEVDTSSPEEFNMSFRR